LPQFRSSQRVLGGGDHDYMPHANSNSKILGGGDHDYMPHANSNSKILGGGDHDYIPHDDSSLTGLRRLKSAEVSPGTSGNRFVTIDRSFIIFIIGIP